MSRQIWTIYHGSPQIVEQPDLQKGKPTNDFGRGFYCTKSPELAKEWACPIRADGFANRYELSVRELSLIRLNEEPYTMMHWLALLLDNRKVRVQSPLGIRAEKFLKDHFLPDVSNADVIIGYRADDSYYSFARSFLNNSITYAQLKKAMHLGELGEQVVLKSDKALSRLKYRGAERVEERIYYPLRIARDRRANEDYQRLLKEEDTEGVYLIDLLRGEVDGNDPRLQ